MRTPPWKVGELARRTGLSVRTLHHYDEIGLLVPSHRTEAGHRLYTVADVARLQQIKSLRQLGFSLDEVRACLDRTDFSPLTLIEMHLVRLREQIELQRKLCERLEKIAAHLRSAEEVSVEEFIQTIEGMNMFEKHYTPEQMEWFKERAQQVGAERIREVEAEWPRLIAAVRAEMDKGSDPASASVQALARRWRGLVHEFSGGNREIENAVQTLYEKEPEFSCPNGIDGAMLSYINQAIAATKNEE
jgi:MerR family transcriptional regulator, thiopeptide resistance regulator